MDTAIATPVFNQTQVKALALLASGVIPEQCATALGITPSAISQMMSNEEFASELATRKFEALRKHNVHDDKLDELEAQIVRQLETQLSLVLEPMKLARLFAIVNAAKRRGSSAPEQITQKQTVLKLNMPVTLIQKFTINSNNQVVSTGEQDLVTIQSSRMKTLLEQSNGQGQQAPKQLTIEAAPTAAQ